MGMLAMLSISLSRISGRCAFSVRGDAMKLGVAAGAIVVFCLWIKLGTWIFGQLENLGWVVHLIFTVVWLIAFRLSFSIYEQKVVARKQAEGLLLALNSNATPIGALSTIVVILLLTVLVIGAEIYFSPSYRWPILFAGGAMLLIVANCVENYVRKGQKH
jgi:hypothetical protein